MFQYSRAILSALLALPGDEFSLVVAYTDQLWCEYIPDREVTRLPLIVGRADRLLAPFWAALGSSTNRGRNWAFRFHPIVREVVLQGCDLWVFPHQDIWSTQFPVPTLVAIHDLMHRYESKFPELSSRVYRYREFYLRRVCRSAKGILVDSDCGKSQVSESYQTSTERLFVLPYVAPAYIYENRCRSNVGDQYGLPAKYLFYPAQFWPHKNHAGLIRAVAKVKSEFPDVRLVLSGSKRNQYCELARLVKALGLQQHVLFPGYIPDNDIPELYKRARALIMPTFFGPTNIPPLEAFALGCPVAVSQIYAMPDQVGDAALMFDPNSVDEMAFCIGRLWQDDSLCRDLLSRGRRRAASWGQREFNRSVHSIVKQLTIQSLLEPVIFQ